MQENFQYYIDVAGTCNLACPSCPVGMQKSKSVGAVSRAKGMMSKETFKEILQKIQENPPASSIMISFFNWGEPLLNQNLPEMILMAKSYGFKTGVSTNFNVDADIRSIVTSEPNYFKISLSGFNQETYGVTHRKGDVNILISNLYRLRYYMDRVGVNFRVFINYHMYKNNMGDDVSKMYELANRLRFDFIPDVASVILPIDFYMNNRQKSDDEKLVESLLLFSMEERIFTGKSLNQKKCYLRDDEMVINHDGSVALCCATYDDSTRISSSFLDSTHQELQKKKYTSPICANCMAQGLHAAVTLRINPKAVNERLAAIGASVRLPT